MNTATSPRRNPSKRSQNKNSLRHISTGKFVQQRGKTSNHLHSVKTIQRGLDRHLQEKNAAFSILRDDDFTKANKALDAKVKSLKKSGKGNKPNAAQPLSAEMIEEMWQKNVLGKHRRRSTYQYQFLEYKPALRVPRSPRTPPTEVWRF